MRTIPYPRWPATRAAMTGWELKEPQVGRRGGSEGGGEVEGGLCGGDGQGHGVLLQGGQILGYAMAYWDHPVGLPLGHYIEGLGNGTR